MRKTTIVALILSLLAGCGEKPGAPEPGVDIAAGKAFAEKHCTGCHTLQGGGRTGEVPNLAAQPAEYLVEAMHAYRDGKRHHAALQDLIQGISEERILEIAGYYASLPALPPEPVVRLEEADAEPEHVEVCTECHGRRGFSTKPGVPSLAGQNPAYLIVATQEYAAGTRDNELKETMLSGLDDVDIERMAMYFTAQIQEPRDPPPFGDVAEGEAMSAMCGRCHGANGISDDPLVPNLAGQEPYYLVEAIRAYRDRERSHEDMMADKSDAEIESIAAYYSVQAIPSGRDADLQLAEIIAKCDRCHGGAVGVSTIAVPLIHGQKAEYLLRVMKEYRDGQRGNSMMHTMSAGYNDELLAQIAEYYATHPQH